MKVAFYKNHRGGFIGLFDAIIRNVTAGLYSHCELIFSDGAAFSSSIADGGCRFKRIDFNPAKWDVLEIDADEAACRQFCNNETGTPYDYPGVFRFLWLAVSESQTRWFCSEICAAALQAGGRLTGIKPWQVHPSRLYRIIQGLT